MKLLTAQQAADLLSVSKRRLIQFVEEGRLKNHSPGREILVERQEVERFNLLPRPPGRPPKRE